MKFVLATIILAGLTGVDSDARKCDHVVCYFVNAYANNMFTPRNIDGRLCTHIVISRFQITSEYRLSTEISMHGYDIITEMVKHKENSDVKILIAIQNDAKCDIFVKMYRDRKSRAAFIEKLVEQLRDRKLDGVKIDEQLSKRGKKQDFTDLIKEMAAHFEMESKNSGEKRLILSVGIPTDIKFVKKHYDIPVLTAHADMVDIGTYDFKMPSVTQEPVHHSPLRSKHSSNTKTIEYVLNYLTKQSANMRKVNVGLSTMVFLYQLPIDHVIYRLKFILPYSQFCRNQYLGKDRETFFKNLDSESGVIWLGYFRRTPKMYAELAFFDDEKNLAEKVQYSLGLGFGGVVIKALNYDDKSGVTCSKRDPYPLVKAVRKSCGLS